MKIVLTCMETMEKREELPPRQVPSGGRGIGKFDVLDDGSSIRLPVSVTCLSLGYL